MRIRVVHADGRLEQITLIEPVHIIRSGHRCRIVSGRIRHWFTLDGFYDGWGMDLSGMSPEQGTKALMGVEAARQFIESQ